MAAILELNTSKAVASAAELIKAVDSIGVSLATTNAALATSAEKILSTLNSIRTVSRGVATDLASISSSAAQMQRQVLTAQEETNKKAAGEMRRYHSEALRENSAFDKKRMQEADTAARLYQQQLKSNMDAVVRVYREQVTERKQMHAMVLDSDKAGYAAELSAMAMHNQAMQQAWALRSAQASTMLRQKLQEEVAAAAEMKKIKLMVLDSERAAAAHELSAQNRHSQAMQSQWRQYHSNRLQAQKLANAAEATEQKNHAHSLATAEKARLREAHHAQYQILTQSTAALRAGMIATGASFGIFTSGTIVTAAAVYGLVVSMRAAVQTGAEFEDTMTRAFAVMELSETSAGAQQLTAQVRELAQVTRFSAVEIAGGLVQLGMAGLSASETVLALRPALYLATIGMTDMAFAADMLTDVMHEFGLEATDLAHIADVLAMASAQSNVSIQSLGSSLSYVGPIAETSNNSLEATTALIELLGDNAIKGSRAGTTLRRAIDDLMDPSESATNVMVRLGVSSKTLSGEMVPLIDFMKQLAAAGADATDMAGLFDITARTGMTVVLKDMQAGFDSAGNAIEGYISKTERYEQANIAATDSAAALVSKLQDTLTADTLQFKTAVTDQALQAFNQVGDGLRIVLRDVTEWVRSIDPQTISDIANGIVAVVAAFAQMAEWAVPLVEVFAAFAVGKMAATTLYNAVLGLSTAFVFLLAPAEMSAAGLATVAAGGTAAKLSLLDAAAGAGGLRAALLALQSAFLPLLAIGAITTAVYAFSTAESHAAENAAKLRAETYVQSQEAKRRAEELAKEGGQAQEDYARRARKTIDENNKQIAEYQENLTRLQNAIAGSESGTNASGFRLSDAAIKTALDEQVTLREKIDGLQQNSLQVERELAGVVDAGTAARRQQAEEVERTAVAYSTAVANAQRLSSLVPPTATTYVADPTTLPRELSPSAALSQEIEFSEQRVKSKQEELSFKKELDEAYLSNFILVQERQNQYSSASVVGQIAAEQQAHAQREGMLQSSHDTYLSFLDAELAAALTNQQAIQKTLDGYQAAPNGGVGGEVFQEAAARLESAAKYVGELRRLRAGAVNEFTQSTNELGNAQIELSNKAEAAVRGMLLAYDPLRKAMEDRKKGESELDYLRGVGRIGDEAYALAVLRLGDAYRNVADPYRVLIEQTKQDQQLNSVRVIAQRTGQFKELAKVELEILSIRQRQAAATPAEVADYAELLKASYEMERAARQAEEFEQSWVQAMDRVDEAFENLWKSGLNGFKDFSETLKDTFTQLLAFLAHETISKPLLFQLGLSSTQIGAQVSAGELGLSSLLPAALTQGAKSFGGVAASGLSGLGSLLSTGAGKVGNLFGLGGGGAVISEAQYIELMGGKSAGGMFSNLSSGADILKSGLYGAAGGFVGTKLGESLFGKEANSSIGASVGGTAGAILGGPIGAAIGAALGGAIDALGGGDGKKRYSAGFSTGPAAVKSQYEYDTTEFDSGLSVTSIARRVDQSASESVIAYFKALDSTFSNTTRQSGRNLDLSGVSLTGTTADAGIDGPGSFFGLKDFNGLGSESALKAQGVTFVKELIAQVSTGFSEEVRQAVNSATGTAEEVLDRYASVLSLDQVFRAGGKVFTNINSFAETLTELDTVFRMNEESLSDTVARVIKANDALTALGIGTGTSSDAAKAVDIAEAAGGVDAFSDMVTYFTGTVIGQERALEESIERLNAVVGKQFSDLGLAVEEFDLASFRKYFDEVKTSLSAVEVVDLIRAGNSLGLLIEKEKELAEVRLQSFDDLSNLLEEPARVTEAIKTLSKSIQQEVADIAGTSISLAAGKTPSEKLDVIDDTRAQILDRYQEQVRAEEALHKVRLDNYKELVGASKRITDALKDLSLGELSPLTSKQKRDNLLKDFNSLYDKALGGDADAANEISAVAKQFLTVERERETINDTYLSSYADITGRLGTLKTKIGATKSPGEFDPTTSAAASVATTALAALQSSLSALQREIGANTLKDVVDLGKTLKDLPKEIADKLSDVLGEDLVAAMQTGLNLGVLNTSVLSVATAIGLLPQATSLSSMGIAQQIELLTQLSKFPTLLSGSIGSLVNQDLLGAIQTALNLGVLVDSLSGVQTVLGLLPTATTLSSLGIAEQIELLTQLSQFPELVDDSLRELLGSNFLKAMQDALDLGALETGLNGVANMLGLLPQATSLSSLGIAQQIEALTNLSNFPALVGANLSTIVGNALVEAARSGAAAVPSLADAVKGTPLEAAWNTFAGNNGYGSVDDYTSSVNPAASNSDIIRGINTILGSGGVIEKTDLAVQEQQVKALHALAAQHGVGSTQIANAVNEANPSAPKVSSTGINKMAAHYGLPAFAEGGLVTRPTIGLIGEGRSPEYVAPVDRYAVVERKRIVSDIASQGAGSTREVVDAVNRNTDAVKAASNNRTIRVVVEDTNGKVLVDRVIKEITGRSENSEYVVSARGVRR